MREYLAPLVKRLTEIATEEMQMDPAHDLNHLHRVCKMALRLLDAKYGTSPESPFDMDMECGVVIASYLHDIFNTPKNEKRPSGEHNTDAYRSALRAKEIMVKKPHDPVLIQYIGSEDNVMIDRIFEAIREHSFTSDITASNFISEVLQDADRLDALGVVGISRIMANSVAMGQKIYHPEDPFATERKLDSTYLFDTWWQTRGMHYHLTFNTPLGKRLGRERTLETFQYFAKFGEEIGHPIPIYWYPKF